MATQRKRLYTIKRLIDTDGNSISWIAYDLDNKPIADMHCRIDMTKVSEANLRYGSFFGINQSVGDTAALGQGATLTQKFSEMRQRIAHFESGSDSWTSTSREPGEGTLLYQALMIQKSTRDPVKTRAFVTGLARSKRDAMLASEDLREIVAGLRAESGKGVDADELFEELDSL